jgi:hypothetical protein
VVNGLSVSEVSELDHRFVLKVVALADDTDKRNTGLGGSLVVTHGVAEENH